MPFTEDLTAFLNTAEFATTAVFSDLQSDVNDGTWTADGGSYYKAAPNSIVGIFDNGYVSAGVDVEVESSSPTFRCESSKVSEVAHGDRLSIDDVDYVVRGSEPDGVGMTFLILEAV